MKFGLFILLKVIVLAIVTFILFGIAGWIAGLERSPPTPEEAQNVISSLIVVCLLNTWILAFIILRSRWTGWKLMAAVFLAQYGVTTVMSQIETAIFVTWLPPGTVPRLFLMGALVALPFSIISVLILGKRKPAAAVVDESIDQPGWPASEWAWKLALIVVAYLVLYFGFGYFVAWQSPAVREYYGGSDEGSFLTNMRGLLENRPWIFAVQAGRALLWTLIALPVIKMLKGSRFETAILIALLFSVVMNTQLLLPNPYMPKDVRMAHLVETTSSNLLFGFLVGWLLFRVKPWGPAGVNRYGHAPQTFKHVN